MENKFPMVAKTFQGLEDVLRDELLALGAERVELGQRMVSFEGDLEMMYKANLCCRTALRILKPIVKFTAYDPDELYSCVRDIDWEKYMTPDSTFSIDSTVSSADFSHSKFVAYRVKDGIADHFNDKYGRRPSVRLSGADVQLNVHIFDNRVTISLDSSGEPLSRRGYKVANTEAPINEVLAAGIIMKTGWRGDCDFADPMCGSGTFLVEAALIAANINPGIYRESFAFEKWPDFDSELFEELYNDDSAERDFAYKIYGGDIDPEAVAIARQNIRSAKVEEMIDLTCRPMSEWYENSPEGVLVMNPPYGERLKPDNMMALYKSIGTSLKTNFKGWHAWLIGFRDEHFAAIGLKPSVKIPLHNGNLECSLREYVLFDGSYNDFRSEGGSIGNLERRKQAPPKVHRMSDREWEEDARKFDGGHPKRRDSKGSERERDRERKASRRDFDRKLNPSPRRFIPDTDDDDSFIEKRRPEQQPRKPFDRDRKPFDRDRKPSDRDRKPFDRDRKPFDRKNYQAADKGPSLPEDSTHRFSDMKMRSRRKK
ncbi:MAG: RNA methyltransferase [Muribaculaceae bacterium]|nr:RNA methyltransferase [Muribaculaceae bacterium]